jgi:3-oxoacyl-[acyl-carrier-protein] synthase II
MELNRVVVTGMGALTPIGNDLATYWENLLAGVSGAATITRFDASNFSTKFACEVKGFDGEAYLGRKETRRTDPFCQFALFVVDEAVQDANVNFDDLDRTRVGVLWASALGGITTTEEQISRYEKEGRPDRFSPFYIPKMLLDASSGVIAMRHGLHGVNYNAVSACASSNAALIDACNYIRLGKADMMITGGSEASITPTMVGGFAAAKALSKRNEDPLGASRPFDRDRDGFVIAEGAGALILESLNHAIKRDAPIYAEIIGSGISADAYHATAAHPEGLGAILSMQAALAEAELRPAEIDYMNVHATSTPVGDISEISALSSVMADDLGQVAISATKSMTGHLLGAAGAVEAIATILSLRDNQIPATINLQHMDPAMPPSVDLVHGQSRRQEVNVGMSNSFGFGGHNATIIFRTLA